MNALKEEYITMNKENAKLPDDKLEEVSGGAISLTPRTHEQTLQYFCSTCKYVFEEKKTVIGAAEQYPSAQFCPNCKKYVNPSHKVF